MANIKKKRQSSKAYADVATDDLFERLKAVEALKIDVREKTEALAKSCNLTVEQFCQYFSCRTEFTPKEQQILSQLGLIITGSGSESHSEADLEMDSEKASQGGSNGGLLQLVTNNPENFKKSSEDSGARKRKTIGLRRKNWMPMR